MQKCKHRLYTATASLSDVYTENGVKLILMKFIKYMYEYYRRVKLQYY